MQTEDHIPCPGEKLGDIRPSGWQFSHHLSKLNNAGLVTLMTVLVVPIPILITAILDTGGKVCFASTRK